MRVLLALAAACGACTTDNSIFDPFPIPMTIENGVVVVGARSTDLDPSGAVHIAVLDTSSPVTVFDADAGVGRGRATVQLYGTGESGGVPRAEFPGVEALLSPTGAVGLGARTAVTAILGADLLVLHALRVDVTASQLHILPNIAADDATLASSCQASFSTPLNGGGSYQIGNDTVRFPASRIVLSVCLAPRFGCDLTADAGVCPGGTDSLLLVSTAVRPIVLSRSVFERMTGLDDGAVDALPTATLYLAGNLRPDGVTVHQTTLAGLAIADRGNHGDDNPARGACLEYKANLIFDPTHGLEGGQCTSAMTQGTSPACPCQNAARACAVGPAIETQRSLSVVVVEDTDPFLQALRDELRPSVGDLSGLIGVEALSSLVMDIDYPHGRTVAVCSGGDATCSLRPAVTGGSSGDVVDQAQALKSGGCFP